MCFFKIKVVIHLYQQFFFTTTHFWGFFLFVCFLGFSRLFSFVGSFTLWHKSNCGTVWEAINPRAIQTSQLPLLLWAEDVLTSKLPGPKQTGTESPPCSSPAGTLKLVFLVPHMWTALFSSNSMNREWGAHIQATSLEPCLRWKVQPSLNVGGRDKYRVWQDKDTN